MNCDSIVSKKTTSTISFIVDDKTFNVSKELLKNSNSDYFNGLVDERFNIESKVYIDNMNSTDFKFILHMLEDGPEEYVNTLRELSTLKKEVIRSKCKFFGMTDAITVLDGLLKPLVKKATIIFSYAPNSTTHEEKRNLENDGYIYKSMEIKGDIHIMHFEK